MAAVESISEVIKDSDKEHVPLAMSEVENDKMNLVNGDTERKSSSAETCVEGKCSKNIVKDSQVPVDVNSTDTKAKSKNIDDIIDKIGISKANVEEMNTSSNETPNNIKDSKIPHDSVSNEMGVNHEPCDSLPGSQFIKKESPDDVSNGTFHGKSATDDDTKNSSCTKSEIKDESMDIDDHVENDASVNTLNGGIQRIKENSENINQDFLLNKLGFSAVKQLSLENMHQVKSETVDVSNYDPNMPNKLVLKAQENILGEMLDGKSSVSSRSNSPGVVMNGGVTDKEDHRVRKLTEQRTLIDSLKEDLRSEEAKLLLLRKVFDSQTNRKNGSLPVHKMKENSGKHMSLPSLHPKGRASNHSYQGSPSEGSSSIQIAPKVIIGSKGASTGSNLPRIVPSIVSSSTTSSTPSGDSPRVTYAQVRGHVPTTGAVSQPLHKYYIQVGNQLVPAAPPTCINQPVYAMPVYTNATSAGAKVTSSISTTAAAPSVKPKIQPTPESQASKHSAAKAALRRQLEQTLLQIPPPRPPSADWRVIPNVNSMDFMMLVGLDEIVDMILENDGKPTLRNVLTETLPENPLICDQCGMDFSPQWKDKEGEKSTGVLCEKCSLTNTKKDLKAEHTSRLKSAFLKALKQEQEIEEKIKAGEDVNIGSPPLEKDVQSSVITHHQPLHSVHKPYKQHSKGQKSDHHHPIVHHHHHQVVQHYPHHTSLVHQLHQQHMQQQQVDYDPPGNSSHRSARWHPYIPSHHHSGSHVHNVPHHRTYSSSSARGSDARHEYYVVHHPQHSSAPARWAH
eukprot:gene5922-11265_t